MEVGERGCDESEGSDTEREIPEGEEHEEEGEEEENIQGQREEQPEGQKVDVDQELHHQFCDEECSYYLQSSAIII